VGFGAPPGAATFLELKDTPETYAGQALKLAKVKTTEDGLNLDLLLSFTDWYAGGAPTSYPWLFEPDVPFASGMIFSPIILDGVTGQYHVFVTGAADEFYKFNIDTKQYHKLTDAPSLISNHLALSPDGNKLAGGASTRLYIYDIEANTWTQSPTAPQITATDVEVMCLVWADNDVIWAWVRADVTGTWTIKCYRYTVSTETWDSYANSITPAIVWATACSIKTDGSAVYASPLGANYYSWQRYTIATDTYGGGNLGATSRRAIGASDRNAKIWTHVTNAWISYWNCDTDSFIDSGISQNTLEDKASNWTGGFLETSKAIYWARAANPKLMSYFGTGSWRLAQKTLTDYNLVVFRKPADGFAISCVNTAAGYYIPIHLFDVLCLPAGTWEFFYPKDGDYTKLKISGSVLK